MSDGWHYKDMIPDYDDCVNDMLKREDSRKNARKGKPYSHHFKIGDIVRLKTGREPMMVIDIKKDVILCSYMIPGALKNSVISAGKKSPGERKTFDISHFCTTNYERSYRRAIDYTYANEGSQQMYSLFGVKETKFWREFDSDCAFAPYLWHNHTNIIEWFRDKYPDLILEFKRMNQYIVTFGDDEQFNNEGETQMSKAGTLYQVVGKEQYGTYLATNSQGKFVLEMKDNSNIPQAFDPKDIEEVVPWTFSVEYGTNSIAHYSGAKDCVKVGDALLRNTTVGIVNKINTRNKGATPFKGSKLLTESFNSDEKQNEG